MNLEEILEFLELPINSAKDEILKRTNEKIAILQRLQQIAPSANIKNIHTINLEKAIEILSDVKNNSDSLGIQNINVTEKIKNEPTSSYFDNENKEKPEQLKYKETLEFRDTSKEKREEYNDRLIEANIKTSNDNFFIDNEINSNNSRNEKIKNTKKVAVISIISLLIILFCVIIVVYLKNSATVPTNNKSDAIAEYDLALQNTSDTSSFIQHLEKASNLNYDSASIILANFYCNKGNYNLASTYIEKLIINKDGKITSKYSGILAMYYHELKEVKNNNIESIKILQSCADEGDPDCEYELGMNLYENKDYEHALTFFRKSAEKDNDKAQTMIGNMYYMEQGVKKDNNTAKLNYLKASNKNNYVAIFGLGLIYEEAGNNVEANKCFLKVAAKTSNPYLLKKANEKIKISLPK